MKARPQEHGFTLLELIIAITLTVTLMAGLAAFLRATLATQAHLSPRDAQIRQWLLLNGQLRHELAAASPYHIYLHRHHLTFTSRARYRALPPGRYRYHYAFHPSTHILFLTVRRAAPYTHPGPRLFQGAVLRHVRNIRFARLLRPSQTRDPLHWATHIKTLGRALGSLGQPVVAMRLTIMGPSSVPPLLYHWGPP